MIRKTLVLTSLLVLIAACAPAVQTTPVVDSAPTEVPATEASVTETAAEALTFTDGLGSEVTLAEPARRVISLAPSNTEILFAVGAGDQVIGRDELSDFPEAAKSIASIGGWMGDFNTEAIVALQPDLVLASELNDLDFVNSLNDLGLTVYYVANPASFEEMYANLEEIGRMTGHEDEAKDLVAALSARVAAVDEKIKPLSSQITVFYELDATDPTKPWTSGPGTFVDLLISRAGGFNVGSSLKDQWAQISSEELIRANPQVILLGDALYGVTVESVAQRPGWDAIAAVQNNAVYPFNPDIATRPGPRLVDALEELAKLLRPELFEE